MYCLLLTVSCACFMPPSQSQLCTLCRGLRLVMVGVGKRITCLQRHHNCSWIHHELNVFPFFFYETDCAQLLLSLPVMEVRLHLSGTVANPWGSADALQRRGKDCERSKLVKVGMYQTERDLDDITKGVTNGFQMRTKTQLKFFSYNRLQHKVLQTIFLLRLLYSFLL